MRISVIGCGYLGAVHAAAMAQLGHDVVGVELDETRLAMLKLGTAPFYEPGLQQMLRANIAAGRLAFTDDVSQIAGAQVHFVAVGTPQIKDGHAADITYVDAAVDSIIPYLAAGDLVVGKSTVPVGTARRLAERITAAGVEATLAWNPEFLREGHAINDTISPDRLVYGVLSSEAVPILDRVYHQALESGITRIVTDLETAELVKASANAFLATKISFINAMAEITDLVGADVSALADALGLDSRIGRRFLNAGVGFGGGCLPKDIRAFTARAEELGAGESVAFLKQVDEINLRQRRRMVDRVIDVLDGSVFNKRITVLGLTFKPNSDDVRDSPALDIAVRLKGLGANVVATDPHGIENSRLRHPQLTFVESLEGALLDADLTILVTEWDLYKEMDPEWARGLVSRPIIIDGRNGLNRNKWELAGWDYRGTGR